MIIIPLSMIKVPKEIEALFYDPRTDSVNSLLRNIKKTHTQLLEKTDITKGILSSEKEEDEALIRNFHIPEKPLQKRLLPSLISNLFQGVSRWHFPKTMYNAAPPPLLSTVVTKMMTALYNPNLALHTASGRSLITEQKVIKAIAEYIGWDREKVGGVFTWGGKATTMYGIKLGLKKCSPDSVKHGVKEDVVVLSTKAGHPSHISDSEWLGIGTQNIVRMATDEHARVDLKEMESTIRKVVSEGKK